MHNLGDGTPLDDVLSFKLNILGLLIIKAATFEHDRGVLGHVLVFPMFHGLVDVEVIKVSGSYGLLHVGVACHPHEILIILPDHELIIIRSTRLYHSPLVFISLWLLALRLFLVNLVHV